jgi:hypothetical protein
MQVHLGSGAAHMQREGSARHLLYGRHSRARKQEHAKTIAMVIAALVKMLLRVLLIDQMAK